MTTVSPKLKTVRSKIVSDWFVLINTYYIIVTMLLFSVMECMYRIHVLYVCTRGGQKVLSLATFRYTFG